MLIISMLINSDFQTWPLINYSQSEACLKIPFIEHGFQQWFLSVIPTTAPSHNGMRIDAGGVRGHNITKGAIMCDHRRQAHYS